MLAQYEGGALPRPAQNANRAGIGKTSAEGLLPGDPLPS